VSRRVYTTAKEGRREVDYTERIDELSGILDQAESAEIPHYGPIILKRIKQLIALRDDQDPPSLLTAGTLVAYPKRPRHTGQVIVPTTADWQRGVHELNPRDQIIVLVQWRSHRSWEYAKDLRPVT
jgi:hypothetical protein